MFLLIRSQFMALAPYLERAALILLVEPFDCEVSEIVGSVNKSFHVGGIIVDI